MRSEQDEEEEEYIETSTIDGIERDSRDSTEPEDAVPQHPVLMSMSMSMSIVPRVASAIDAFQSKHLSREYLRARNVVERVFL